MHPSGFESLLLAFDRFAFALEIRPLLIADQAQFAANRCEAHIGVVFAQAQTVFGTAGEHTVRLGHPFGDQVVHQYAEVGFVPRRAPFIFVLCAARGICTRE